MMYQKPRQPLARRVALAGLILLAGVTTVALAQGSGGKNEGGASKAQGSASKAADTDKQESQVKAELNAEALKALMDADVPMVLLDARGKSPQWIAGAVPVAHDAEDEAVRKAAGEPDQLVVTYCGGPECPLSLMLANRLAELGYHNVIRFTGGVEAWTEAGYDLKSKDKSEGSATKQEPGSSSKNQGSSTR